MFYTRFCETCHQKFTTTQRIQTPTGKPQRFCSRKCFNAQRTHVVFKCKHCKEDFRPSHIIAKFCSQKCMGLARHKPRFKKCEWCKKTYPLNRANGGNDNKKFCSATCHNEWLTNKNSGPNNSRWKPKIEVSCPNCNAPRLIAPWEVRKGHGSFCNRKCYAEYLSKTRAGENCNFWKGGHSLNYGQGWIKAKRAARKRDEWKCQWCGKRHGKQDRTLATHHFERLTSFNGNTAEANNLNNLVCVCRYPCHSIVESCPQKYGLNGKTYFAIAKAIMVPH